MKAYTFHWEYQTILQQFADALNDVIIKRYNENRSPVDQIHANFVYMPKTRTLTDLINKNQHLKMPVIAVTPTSLRRDVNRVFNKIDGSYFADTRTKTPSAWAHLMQPVPVNIDVTVSFLSRFQWDIDQMLTNFIPYSDPYFVVSWKWPDIIPFADFEIRSHIKWSENINFSVPVEIAANQSYWYITETGFTIESWMFKNSINPQKPIYVIDHSFTSLSEFSDYNIMKSWEDELNTEVKYISARPQMSLVTPFFTFVKDVSTEFQVVGKMLDYIENVYLSSVNWSMFDTSSTGEFIGPSTIDVFSVSSFYASAHYPAFTAVQLASANWSEQSSSILNFCFTPKTTGYFDVILLNKAGYSIMSKDVIRPTTNPYPSSMPEYNTYIEYQYPIVSGIEVKGV